MKLYHNTDGHTPGHFPVIIGVSRKNIDFSWHCIKKVFNIFGPNEIAFLELKTRFTLIMEIH